MASTKPLFDASGQVVDFEDQQIVLADGLESSFVGVAMRFGWDQPVAVYDITAVITGLESSGMTRDEAAEFFEYNIRGAYVGDQTPIFIEKRLLCPNTLQQQL